MDGSEVDDGAGSSAPSALRLVADRLADIAAEFARIDTLPELAGVSERAIGAFVPVEYNGLYLWDPMARRLRLLYAHGFTEEERAEAERTVMERNPGEVFRSGLALHVPDTRADLLQRSQSNLRHFEVRTRLFLPVLYRDEVVGVFGLASTQPHAFSAEHISIVRFVCRLAGVVYRRICDHMERQASDAQARAELTRINGALLSTQRQLLAANDALEARVEERTGDLAAKNLRLAEALSSLQRTQEQLIQAEKMASLGLLVAGIAHEIKNPLNFVNNFAELSLEFTDELAGLARALDGSSSSEALGGILPELAENLRRIHEHGRRADTIINAMLMHAREKPGEPVLADLNDLVHAHVVLAYQGFRSNDRTFVADLVEDFDPSLTTVPLAYQELSRVILNLVANACYAMRERQRAGGDPRFRPVLRASTRRVGDSAVIRVCDNGTGIPDDVRRRIFDPFFTTKPPGEGTGLGLSMCYDIIVKQLSGNLAVDSVPGTSCEFTVTVPIGPSSESEALR
jgi:signal transduction histidine kinase